MTAPAAPAPLRASGAVRRPRPLAVILALTSLLLIATIVAAAIGSAGIPLHRLAAILGLAPADPATIGRDQLILWSIRLPRIALAAMVGGLLAVSGAVMQGLFRNPLADPALVGVSGGAALAAATTIVVSDKFLESTFFAIPFEVLPVTALVGALIATALLYRLATREGRTSIAIFLLGGLAIAALANAAIGLLVFLADDRQLRDITFWMLGSLSGATWAKAAAILPFFLATAIALPLIARGLDLLVLGEAEAFHSGIHVERLKKFSILLIAAAVGAAVSVSGVIGFVGIVVPHLLRLVVGPAHRILLPASIILGAALMVGADILSRTLAAPAELPIGIVTAVVGAPFFLALLLRQRTLAGL
jgi:iron complex transport system permease protein